MNTRRANPGGELSQERFMSSPEYAERRGLSGIAVAQKAAVVEDAAERSLMWFLHALSWRPGGLEKVSADLVAMFPERVGTTLMHIYGMKPGQIYKAARVREVRNEVEKAFEVGELADLLDESDGPEPLRRYDGAWPLAGEERWNQRGDNPKSYLAASFVEHCREAARSQFAKCFVALCIDPKFRLDLQAGCNHVAWQVRHFQNPVDSLRDFKRRFEADARQRFVMTEVAEKIFETLDCGLEGRQMVLARGLPGRGKSFGARAWCEMHLGEARYVELKSNNSKTSVFREVAKALGIASSYTRTATDMQLRIEDTLEKSGLMIIFDESHWLFSQGARIYSRPELIDWVGTALCNRSVPIGLIATPQIMACLRRAEDQVGWNSLQFKRRCKRHVVLPDKNRQEDMERVVRFCLPRASAAMTKKIIGYAIITKRYLSAVGDAIREARLIADSAGREDPTYEDVSKAVDEILLPSDAAWNEPESPRPQRPRGRPPGMRQRGDCLALPEAPDADVSDGGRRMEFPDAIRSNLIPGTPALTLG